jgi:hypothetical protein
MVASLYHNGGGKMRTSPAPSTEEYEGRILLLRDTLQIALGFLESLETNDAQTLTDRLVENNEAQSLADRVVKVLNDTR